MRHFVISTDTCCDLPESYCVENNIDIHPLYYRFGDEVYGGETQLPMEEFYTRMRNGEMPTTMAVNPETSKELFLRHIQNGEDILHIAFSSGLSSSYQNAVIAANELMEEYPDSRIIVIDSLCASLGQGLLVHEAVRLMKEGLSLDELAAATSDARLHVAHHFTVDNLFHLFRGGRVSRATAIVGTLAGIKPLLHVDNEGHLINIGKVRGRKKSLTALVDRLGSDAGSYLEKSNIIGISHGDSLEDAKFVASLVEERYGKKEFIINTLCPTIGSHTGPDLIALFFFADKR